MVMIVTLKMQVSKNGLKVSVTKHQNYIKPHIRETFLFVGGWSAIVRVSPGSLERNTIHLSIKALSFDGAFCFIPNQNYSNDIQKWYTESGTHFKYTYLCPTSFYLKGLIITPYIQ